MNDLKPFKHGEEGTHSVCNKHNIDGNSVCCECSGKDDCGDEPMTYTEKRLKEFDNEYHHIVASQGGFIVGKKGGQFDGCVSDLSSIRDFLAESIDQAVEEDRENVKNISKCPPPYPADKENPMKHIYQNEGYCKALDDILSRR